MGYSLIYQIPYFSIQIITLLIGILAFILILSKMKNDSLLTIIINIQFILICSLYPFCIILKHFFNTNITTFFSPISELGKIAFALIIMLLIQLNFVPQSSQKTRETLYFVISIFIGWVVPLSISVTALILNKNWNEHKVLLITVVSLKYCYIAAFFTFSILLSKDITKLYKQGDIMTKEFYEELKKTMIKYRIAVIYYLVTLLYYSILDILEFRKILEVTSVPFNIASFLHNAINGIFLLTFIFNIERWKVLFNILSCGYLCQGFKEIRPTNETTIFELLGYNE